MRRRSTRAAEGGDRQDLELQVRAAGRQHQRTGQPDSDDLRDRGVRLPIELSYSRAVARVQILVNGIRVNVFSTHLDADSASRTTQMNELKSWASSFSEQRILAGDFNAWPGAAEISNMTSSYIDTWAAAVAATDGRTRETTQAIRATAASTTCGSRRARPGRPSRARGFSTCANSRGVMPSDHRPVMTTLEVK